MSYRTLGLLPCVESPKSTSVQQGKCNALCRPLLAPDRLLLLTSGGQTDRWTDQQTHIYTLFMTFLGAHSIFLGFFLRKRDGRMSGWNDGQMYRQTDRHLDRQERIFKDTKIQIFVAILTD